MLTSYSKFDSYKGFLRHILTQPGTKKILCVYFLLLSLFLIASTIALNWDDLKLPSLSIKTSQRDVKISYTIASETSEFNDPEKFGLASHNDKNTRPTQASQPLPQQVKPLFEFYQMLPSMEVESLELPTEKLVAKNNVILNPSTPLNSIVSPPNSHYVLQAGSFRHADDADSFKAQLALAGFESSIQVVRIQDTTWYRVTLGPYLTEQEAAENRKALKLIEIDNALILKQKN